MSRYDYSDPGTDPAYCDGLAPSADDEWVWPQCIYCSVPFETSESPYDPYCSKACSVLAETEDESTS